MNSIPFRPDSVLEASHGPWWHFGAVLAFSAGVVVGAQLWFRGIQALWPSDHPTVVGAQFGSFMLVLGAFLSWFWGGDAALRIGDTFRRWREVAGTGIVLSSITLVFVSVSESNVYSDADVLFETVLVPVGEELVFRGVVLGWLLAHLSTDHNKRAARGLAVLFSGIAFGAAHASNALFGAGGFVVIQVLAATGLGLVFGALRVRTRSLLAPMALHALVNGINLMG